MTAARGASALGLRRMRRRCEQCGAPHGSVHHDRPFTLLDAMVLVAASAVSFLLVRNALGSHGAARVFGPEWARKLAALIGGLVTWTPTVLALKLRQPRPARQRLSRQPDFVAGLAATSILAIGLLAIGIVAIVRVSRQAMLARMQTQATISGRTLALPRTETHPDWWLWTVAQFGAVAGVAVIGAWIVLAFSGRRRPSHGWLNLLGRAIGVAWIFVFVVGSCARLGYLRD